MRLILLLCLGLYYSSCLAQSNDEEDVYSLGIKYIQKNKHLVAIDTIQKLKQLYINSHTSKLDESIIATYDNALALFNSFIGNEYTLDNKHKQVKNISSEVTFTAALPYIIKQAKHQKVIMINEHHNVPKHRLLTYNLLVDLYKLGYKYLAVEALVPEVPYKFNLNYPGPYVHEPNMTNLLKKAVSIGYKLVAYESQDTTEENSKRPYLTFNLRELHQANNLYQIFIKDPKAKVLVHAGHEHIWEQGGKYTMTMAENFKALSGIDPLTINQSVAHINEFTNTLNASSTLKKNDQPYIVLNNRGIPRISSHDQKGDYDLLLSWPSPKVIYGREDYMLAKKGCKTYAMNVSQTDRGKLLQIRNIKDGPKGIPVDQFIIKDSTTKVATALPPGIYTANLIDSNGKLKWSRKISIK